MKILLINNNPVVSRLTALSARKEDIEIDEIQEVTELTSYNYDIVFVDADSWNEDVKSTIFTHVDVNKKVLFYAQDDQEEQGSFDTSILKPFLPSEVSAVIRSVEESEKRESKKEEMIKKSEKVEHFDALADAKDEKREKKESKKEEMIEKSEKVEHFDVLADAKDEKREPLFDLEDNLAKIPDLETVEEKSNLMDELKKIDEDIIDEKDSFDQKLEEAFPLKSDELEDDLFEKTPEILDAELKTESAILPEKKSDDLFELDLNDDKFSLEDELFTEETKTDKLASNDEILDFDFDKNDELDFASEKVTKVEDSVDTSKEKIEEEIVTALDNDIEDIKEEISHEDTTKVLDQSEIANIKEILQDKKTETMELEDLMAPSIAEIALPESKTDKSEELEKKKSKRDKSVSTVDSEVIVETLAALKIETLKELLAGTTVTINIKFPKAK